LLFQMNRNWTCWLPIWMNSDWVAHPLDRLLPVLLLILLIQ
jgi:hypothetical protein